MKDGLIRTDENRVVPYQGTGFSRAEAARETGLRPLFFAGAALMDF